MTAILPFLSAGLLLGLSSGLAPGPLLTLVASETLHHGAAAGIRVALAPLLTDAPIILATLLVLQPLTDQQMPLALLHLAGGLYLGWLAVEGLRFQGADLSPAPAFRFAVARGHRQFSQSQPLFILADRRRTDGAGGLAGQWAGGGGIYRRILCPAGGIEGVAGAGTGPESARVAQSRLPARHARVGGIVAGLRPAVPVSRLAITGCAARAIFKI